MGKVLGRETELALADAVVPFVTEGVWAPHGAIAIHVGGSTRRRCPVVRDVDLLVVTDRQTMGQLQWKDDWHVTPKTAVLDVAQLGVRVEAWWCPVASLGPMLQFVTGPADLNVWLRRRAQKRHLKLSQYGLFDQGGVRLDDNSEEDVFALLDVPFLSPIERETWREVIEPKWS